MRNFRKHFLGLHHLGLLVASGAAPFAETGKVLGFQGGIVLDRFRYHLPLPSAFSYKVPFYS